MTTMRIGIVVPTLGERPEYLLQSLRSIRSAGEAHVALVAPKSFDYQRLVYSQLIDQFVEDPGLGLPAAINKGISELPEQIEYVNWLGDDDQLIEGSLSALERILDSDPGTALVYGSCEYVDEQGQKAWFNKSGSWASSLLHFGPDLIPQPGALFRRGDFEAVGGLSTEFNWAFDFDLFLKLKVFGKLRYVNKTLSKFRWHPESLSVEFRQKSVDEASKVRLSHLPRPLKPLSFIWEYPVRKATLVAGRNLSKKSKR